MSYIRSGSNPEGAYVFGTGKPGGPIIVEFYLGVFDESRIEFCVKLEDFEAVCKDYSQYFGFDDDEEIKHGAFSIREVYTNRKTGKYMPKFDVTKSIQNENPIPFDNKVGLFLDGKFQAALYEVTWDRIVHNCRIFQLEKKDAIQYMMRRPKLAALIAKKARYAMESEMVKKHQAKIQRQVELIQKRSKKK